jgi:hypothetical protein
VQPSLYVDNYVHIQDNSLSFKNINCSALCKAYVNNSSVSQLALVSPGADYNPESTVLTIDPPNNGGTQAVGQLAFSSGIVTKLNLGDSGSNYH